MISDTYIFAQSTLSVYNHQKVSPQLENIEEAYAAHPTPDVFINFASVRRFCIRFLMVVQSKTLSQFGIARHYISESQGFCHLVGFCGALNTISEVPFPMGINVRSRVSKKQNISREENNRERSLDTGNGKVFSYRDSSSGSTKDLE
ncbi:hypothetical protein Tco_1087655 [Tanacetum coccineum]